MNSMQQLYLKTRNEWRDWLSRNYDTSPGVWLVIYKKETGKPALDYDEVVEEALCFGWIDSTIKKLDDEKYVRKLTPRKSKSQWSELNKKRIAMLEKQNLMTEAKKPKHSLINWRLRTGNSLLVGSSWRNNLRQRKNGLTNRLPCWKRVINWD